jgi:uncharacterized RDD family membrane protein YckC
VKVADFGLAKVVSDEQKLPEGRKAIGTPAYMSPEQATFDAVDHRSDIYSLGATFFHLLTGKQPFKAETGQDLIQKHATERVPSPRQLKPDLPQSVCDVILKMMAKWPPDRYQTYDELIADLEQVKQELGQSVLMEAQRERARVRKSRLAVFAIDSAVILVPAVVSMVAAERVRFFTGWAGMSAACAIGLLAAILYSTIMLAWFGRTFGLMAMGLRLGDGTGARPRWVVLLVRSLMVNAFYLPLIFPRDIVAWVLLVLWLVNLAAAFFTKDMQPAHDFLCGTVVTADRASESSPR